MLSSVLLSATALLLFGDPDRAIRPEVKFVGVHRPQIGERRVEDARDEG
jgi:hypothetical protein